jgi:hypothetical protein
MMFATWFTLISEIFHKVLIYLVFNFGWQKNLSITILDFPRAMGLKKGQGQGARFTNFETHSSRRSGTEGGQHAAFGGTTWARCDHVVQAQMGL